MSKKISKIQVSYNRHILDWPKDLLRFFHNILQKNPNKLLGQPSTIKGASQVMLVIKKKKKKKNKRNLLANAGDIRDAGSIHGSGRFPGGGHGNPLQYSCLENPMGRGTWRATVSEVTKEVDTTEATAYMQA